jgi:hypothetical protein
VPLTSGGMHLIKGDGANVVHIGGGSATSVVADVPFTLTPDQWLMSGSVQVIKATAAGAITIGGAGATQARALLEPNLPGDKYLRTSIGAQLKVLTGGPNETSGSVILCPTGGSLFWCAGPPPWGGFATTAYFPYLHMMPGAKLYFGGPPVWQLARARHDLSSVKAALDATGRLPGLAPRGDPDIVDIRQREADLQALLDAALVVKADHEARLAALEAP